MSALDLDTAARRTADIENAAEAVHHAKQYLVDLDRRINMDREGLRAIKKNDAHAMTKTWVLCPGGVFIAGSKQRVTKLLEKDVVDSGALVESARRELKARVVELAHLEGPDSAIARASAGFELRSAGL